MKPNPYDDYLRPRDAVETAAGYAILLIVALVAVVPMFLPDRVPDTVTVAARTEAVVAPDREATRKAAHETAATARNETF